MHKQYIKMHQINSLQNRNIFSKMFRERLPFYNIEIRAVFCVTYIACYEFTDVSLCMCYCVLKACLIGFALVLEDEILLNFSSLMCYYNVSVKLIFVMEERYFGIAQ